MAKWEYCRVLVTASSANNKPSEAEVQYSAGPLITYKEAEATFAPLFKMLGDQGWELVSYSLLPLTMTPQVDTYSVGVFKRPL